jgi:DNA modification methylase
LDYSDFLQNKVAVSNVFGFEVDAGRINPGLKPHQRDSVLWALRGGRRALFESFGLGKTVQQLEIMRVIGEEEQGRQLIIAPLGVRQEFRVDAEKFGCPVPRFIRFTEELQGPGLYITNYESVRDGRLDVNQFNAVSLDEASVLRSYGSKTFQEFLTLFQGVKYRFVATATPSPNRYKELIHYAGFLGIMDTGQALTRWFKRDSQKANNLTLYPHKEHEFWLWVSSWALFLQKPSDLGYSDEGYVLPKLHVHYHKVKTDWKPTVERDGQVTMFADASPSLRDAAREKRDSMPQRIECMKEILREDPDSHFLLWHDQEAERHAIKEAVPAAVEVFGSLDLEDREERIIGFSNGEFQYLASKPVLSGSGCNFQRHCHKAIFLGIGFKFNDFIQSIHRIHRFLQEHECHIHIIYADTEEPILEVLQAKWKRHDEMVERMSEIIREYGLSHAKMAEELKRTIGVKRVEFSGRNWKMVNNDCVEECRAMDSDSVDLIHTSIPFSNHYEYTPSYNDFGHTQSNDHFWEQMDFLTPDLLRILRPGRIYACHVKDRILFGNVTGKGVPTVSPFHAETIFHCMRHGFDYMGMITVVTDVVRENNQTYRLGWSEQCKDGTKMGVGSPEYIILLRKPQTDRTRGYADIPVTKSKEDYTRARWQVDAHAFWRSSGDRLLTADELAEMGPDRLAKAFTAHSLQKVYSYADHVKIGEALEVRGALPATFMAIAPGSHHPDVWHDVNRMLTLNGSQSRRQVQLHICPLQFDIVDRIITRYTNEGETVFDPFAGIGTVPVRAVKLGRKGMGVELNPDSVKDAVVYLDATEREMETLSLFDFMKTGTEE